MQIHQFRMQFSPEQDRIIFSMNTLERDAFRFYFTRRFVRLLWPVLLQLLEEDYQRREPEKSHMADVMLDFEQEKVVSKADFQKKYEEDNTRFPLGEEALLLSRIQVRKGPDGNILCLLPGKGKGIEVPANPRFLYTFCKLMEDTVAKAQWDLTLERPQQNPAIQPTGVTVH
ncbi:hypothetical protein DENIS_2651 [Desulfonema ishimotonii]|uniref:Uncharacterized protein n=1 Tax=Desulfonema ishimotonii TaxID=45657 RepID=A0A401FXL7_9BACT|nr:hypothetical protein [Desulfonema ishimotonii]GBC61689.1 hypothetical protein DENIS_2651 [Desulfonema ishimotonii]